MSDNPNQPKEYDAVLGGQTLPPVQSVILGGIEGVKHRFNSSNIAARTAALSEALNYGEEGLNLVIGALDDKFRKVRHVAAQLLQQREEIQAKLALQNYKFWSGFERLNKFTLPYGHATTFANRKVVEFDDLTLITDPTKKAYALRVSSDWKQDVHQANTTILDKFQSLIKNRHANKIEALVIGFCGHTPYHTLYPVVDMLVSASKVLKNLKAVFIGDIDNSECNLPWVKLSNISQILVAYPNLEVLKIRCSEEGYEGLAFELIQHNKLKALIVESNRLSPKAINDICVLELPALEYLELWLGIENGHIWEKYSSFEHLMPIISGQRFPKLKSLRLRHSEDSIYIALALVDSPLIEQLIELDLSMGDLEDEGAEILLNCPSVHQLDSLNLSANYLSREMIARLKQLDVEVIIDNFDYHGCRYCTASE